MISGHWVPPDREQGYRPGGNVPATAHSCAFRLVVFLHSEDWTPAPMAMVSEAEVHLAAYARLTYPNDE